MALQNPPGLEELSTSAIGEMGLNMSFPGGGDVVGRFEVDGPLTSWFGEAAPEVGLGEKPGVDDLDWKKPRDRR